LRDVLGRSAELAAKLVKLVLKLALFGLEFSIENVDESLVQIPEVIKLHLFQFSVFHSPPQATIRTTMRWKA